MVKKLDRSGDDRTLGPDPAVQVSADGRAILVSPLRDRGRCPRVREALDRLDERYAGVFRRLAG
jgi:hypothetical protein